MLLSDGWTSSLLGSGEVIVFLLQSVVIHDLLDPSFDSVHQISSFFVFHLLYFVLKLI